MKEAKQLLITGASGFVGTYAVPVFQEKYKVAIASLQKIQVDSLDLPKIHAVVHLAGMAHRMERIDPAIYFQVNRDLTLELAKKAKNEGVKHFVFVSTVKVYGDTNEMFLNEKSPCTPTDPYGQSKWEAEQLLQELETKDFKVAIVRPPLVYGKNVKGNLERIIRLIKKLPVLPFGNINNQRSMVFVGNLTALILQILDRQESGVFIAGDKAPASTTQLIKAINDSLCLDKPIVSLPSFMRFLVKKGKPELYSRLFENYVIDNTATNAVLDFVPPFTFEEGVREMVG